MSFAVIGDGSGGCAVGTSGGQSSSAWPSGTRGVGTSAPVMLDGMWVWDLRYVFLYVLFGFLAGAGRYLLFMYFCYCGHCEAWAITCDTEIKTR